MITITNLQLLGILLIALALVCIAMRMEMVKIAQWTVEQLKDKK